MGTYKCINCGYKGEKLIFQCNIYDYCIATNESDPEYLDEAPRWVKEKGYGGIELGEPVACPKCRAWGLDNFELV